MGVWEGAGFSELELSCVIAQCVSGNSVNLSYAQYKLTIQISVGKMMYDEYKGKGVKEKGTTCHKVFINKEASYGSVLD